MDKEDKLIKFITKGKLYRFIKKVTSRIILPGFDKMPLFDVIVFFVKGILNGALSTRASSVAFKFFIAIFPAIIFLFTLIPYIPFQNFQETLMNSLQAAVPENAYQLISTTISDIISRQNGGLLSLGFLLALYFSSNGILGCISAFNITSHSIETRSIWMQYLISILLVIIISLLLLIATSVMVLSVHFFDFLISRQLIEKSAILILFKAAKWLIVIFTLFLAISFLYYLAPAKKERFRFVSAGSTLATLLFMATTGGFNYYVNNFASYNIVYGSIGTIIVIMMWFYFNALSLLIGFELNASISSAKNASMKLLRKNESL